MANTRFFSASINKVLRYTTGTYPRIANGNGSYTSPPALVGDAQYPMANLHNPSRYTPWLIPAGSDNSGGSGKVYLDIDLGADTAIVQGGFFALRWAGASSSITFNIDYRTNAQGYLNTSYTAGTSGTLLATDRDKASSAFSIGGSGARYFRITLTNAFASAYSIGKIALCTAGQDLGILYSPGMDDELIHPAIQSRTGSGHLSVISVGDDRRLISMPLNNIDDTMKGKVDAVFGPGTVLDPAIWLDKDSVGRQVVLANGSLRWRHMWGNPNLWTSTLELEVLG